MLADFEGMPLKVGNDARIMWRKYSPEDAEGVGELCFPNIKQNGIVLVCLLEQFV